MELHETLEGVEDFAAFLAFARMLREDRLLALAKEREAPTSPWESQHGWENITIEDFLAAAVAWAETTQCGVRQGIAADNTWRQFAAFLYCGKIYE